MAHSTTITFEHGKGNEPSNEDDGELCQDEIEVELESEPGEMYGQDADGNRGIWIGPSVSRANDPPAKCEECGHIYTDEELARLTAEMDKAAEEYEYEPDEPDFDYPDLSED